MDINEYVELGELEFQLSRYMVPADVREVIDLAKQVAIKGKEGVSVIVMPDDGPGNEDGLARAEFIRGQLSSCLADMILKDKEFVIQKEQTPKYKGTEYRGNVIVIFKKVYKKKKDGKSE